jgi:hypothetical protein
MAASADDTHVVLITATSAAGAGPSSSTRKSRCTAKKKAAPRWRGRNTVWGFLLPLQSSRAVAGASGVELPLWVNSAARQHCSSLHRLGAAQVLSIFVRLQFMI